MKKRGISMTALGMAGAVLLTMNGLNMNAAVIATEQPIAGISVSLDKYYGTVMGQRESMKTASKETQGGCTTMKATNPAPVAGRGRSTEDTSGDEGYIAGTASASGVLDEGDVMQPTPAPTPEPTPEPKEIKDLLVNINYDRLGIAKVEDNYLNIREEPKEDGKIIGKLPKNAGCHIYEIDENGWAKIVSGEVTGYVSSKYLITDEEAEEYALTVGSEVAVVATDTLNVRFVPSTDSAMYSQIRIDEELDIVKKDLTREFVEEFIHKNFKDENAVLISNVDQEAMMDHLEDWMCVTIDNEEVFVAKEFVEIAYKLKKASKFEEVKEDAASGISSLRAQMVSYAMEFLGNRYVYGGTSLTNGVDCSGYVMRIYQHFGYNGIPRNSASQYGYTRSIKASELKPGDLIFYGNSSGRVNHVAMYIGNGQVIHASNPKNGIRISYYTYRTPLKYGRIIND